MANVVFKKITSAATTQRLVDPMKFNVVLECTKEMEDDIEFEAIYSGDARCEDFDQKICSMLVGPVPAGVIGFVLETDPVNVGLISPKEVFGVTSVIIVGRYRSQQFLRIGYILNVRYPGIADSKLVNHDEEPLPEEDIGSSDEGSTDEDDENEDRDEDDEEEEESETDSEENTDNDKADGDVNENTVKRTKVVDEESPSKEDSTHGLRTTEECLIESKYSRSSEQLKEELAEEVHESSFSEIEEDLEKTLDQDIDENRIVVNGIELDKRKIEIEFMEPPVTTIFEIDWEQEHTIEGESDEGARSSE